MINLNPAIVQSRLSIQPEAVCGQPRQELSLQDVRMLPPEYMEAPAPGYLYLTNWERIRGETKLPDSIVCIGGGEAARAVCERCGASALIYPADTDSVRLFTELQEVFSAFHEMHNEYRSLLIAQYPMCDIINACARFFENYLLLLDGNGNVLESSTEFLTDGGDDAERQRAGAALAEKLSASIRRWNQAHRNGAPQPFRYAEAEADVPAYCVASFYDGSSCIGMLVVCGGDRPLFSETEPLLRYAANLMTPCMKGRYSPSVRIYSFIRSSINALLDNQSVNRTALISSLGTIGWNVRDDYQLVYIRMAYGSARNIRTTLADYYRYENIFPDCIAAKSVSSTVLLVHNTSEAVMRSCLPDLRQLMTSHRLDCCISLPFGDFFSMREHFELARSALEMGGHRENVVFYRDVMMKHVIKEMGASFPMEALCHISAVRIREYDRQNGTNLLLALEKYLLHNRSLQDAATELFIHRNTMNYRLKCISKIVDLSLDSPRERQHLLMSCIILRNIDEDEHGA